MKAWLTVYRKELVDVLRDRRTLTAMLLVPMVLYPAILLLTTETVARQQAAAKARHVSVAMQPGLHGSLADTLLQREDLSVTASVTGHPRDVLRNHDVYLALSSSGAQALNDVGTATVTMYSDDSRAFAGEDTSRLRNILRDFGRRTTAERLKRQALGPEFVRPVVVRERNVASNAERTGHILSLILPALLIVMVAVSCMYPAIDMVAGEKERKTLATLLTAPVPSRDFVVGKYLAVLTVGGLAGLANLGVLALTFFRVLGSQSGQSGFEFSFTVATVLGLMLAVLATAAPVSALLLLAGSFARSFRDANLLLTPVLMLCTVPAFLVTQPTSEPSLALSAIPVLGAGYAMRGLLDGSLGFSAGLVAMASSTVVTALLLSLITRVFADERALFSLEGRRADFGHVFFASPQPGLSSGLAFFGATFGLSFFASGLVKDPIGAAALSLSLSFGLPALLTARWTGAGMGHVLALRWPSARIWLGATLIALSGWLALSMPLGWLSSYLVPGQEAFAEQFASKLGLDDTPLWLLLVALAALPAVVEELAFRGVLMHLLSPLKPQSVLLLQAGLFGLAHGSAYRFLPTAGLGLVLGLVRQRGGSIWPCMLIHFATNAILLSGATLLKDDERFVRYTENPSLIFLAGLTVTGLGLLVLKRRP